MLAASEKGSEATSAQEITSHPGIVRDSAPEAV